jgi:hypothetical protein
MNIDFHYYLTYIAARNAGYEHGRALTIAHSAQYVDVSDKSMIKTEYLTTEVSPIPTVETLGQLFNKNNLTN